MQNGVYSITVTYNPDINLINRQIDSLLNQVHNIIIIDNGSYNAEELKNFLQQKSKEVNHPFTFICNAKNMGLGYAQNQGLQEAVNKNASDILILDHDSIVETGFINNLLVARNELISKGIRVGAIGPVYYGEHNNQFYPITKFWGPFIKRLQPTQFSVEASFLIASGCFINCQVLADVGFMNEDLFIDCVDVEWSFRANAKGYKLFVTPKAKMMHTIGDKRMNVFGRSISVHSPLRRYYLNRNSVMMIKIKTTPLGYKIRESTVNLLRLFVFLTVSKERSKYLKYSLSGLLDGLKGIGGECRHKF